MNCANPTCGHPRWKHNGRSGCMVTNEDVTGRHATFCACNAFVSSTPSREPLMAQLDALIESRTRR